MDPVASTLGVVIVSCAMRIPNFVLALLSVIARHSDSTTVHAGFCGEQVASPPPVPVVDDCDELEPLPPALLVLSPAVSPQPPDSEAAPTQRATPSIVKRFAKRIYFLQR